MYPWGRLAKGVGGAVPGGALALAGGALFVAILLVRDQVPNPSYRRLRLTSKDRNNSNEKTGRSNRRSRSTSKDRHDSGNTPTNEEKTGQENDQGTERRGPERPGDKKKPSKRGEHVINNSVLSIYRDIVQRFVNEVLGEDWDELKEMLGEDSRVLRDIANPLAREILVHRRECSIEHLTDGRASSVRCTIESLIGELMVVRLEKPYYDNNALPYGEHVEALRRAAVAYMEEIYNLLECPPLTEEVRREIDTRRGELSDEVQAFIAGEIFVDRDVLPIWNERGGSRLFEEARRDVESMLRALVPRRENTMLPEWVRELREAAKKLRKKRSEQRQSRRN